MQMEAGLDTGPVLARVRETIRPDDCASSLHDRLANQGAELMVRTLAALPGITSASYAERVRLRVAEVLPEALLPQLQAAETA